MHALPYISVSGAEHQQEALSLDYQEKATRAHVAASQVGSSPASTATSKAVHDNLASYHALLPEARRLNKAGEGVDRTDGRFCMGNTRASRVGRYAVHRQLRGSGGTGRLRRRIHSS